MLRRERHAHRLPSLVRGANVGSTSRVSDLSQRKFRRSEGSGVLIGDPLREGSNASSTNRRPITELWGAENSFFRMRWLSQTLRRERHAHK